MATENIGAHPFVPMEVEELPPLPPQPSRWMRVARCCCDLGLLTLRSFDSLPQSYRNAGCLVFKSTISSAVGYGAGSMAGTALSTGVSGGLLPVLCLGGAVQFFGEQLPSYNSPAGKKFDQLCSFFSYSLFTFLTFNATFQGCSNDTSQ